MDKKKLKEHVAHYIEHLGDNPDQYREDVENRQERCRYYQGWTAERLMRMSEEQFAEYLAPLWALQMWGNKQYVVDKILEAEEIGTVTKELSLLLWGHQPLAERWDHFRGRFKGIGMGPAMLSELLCYTHPDECMVWNRRAYVGLKYLGVPNLPRYDYQVTGERYAALSEAAKAIVAEMKAQGAPEADLLFADYFIWAELQVEDNLQAIHKKKPVRESIDEKTDAATAEFIHNEVRDKLAEIGRWLGFDDRIEVKVADGSVVDTVWEAAIGNMGRVIYVFEVQTKGNKDSLILNLLKSLKNPAVQGVVAVSDAKQLDVLRKHAEDVPGLKGKLKYWDYQEVLKVHEQLSAVNESINSLNLVPVGF